MSPAPDPAPFAARLSAQLGVPVELAFGRARRNVIVVRRSETGVRVRLNAAFAEAPEGLWDDLAAWIRSGRRARAAAERLDAYVEELGRALGPPARRAATLHRRGEVHDLEELARGLLREQFAGELPASFVEHVTWGRRGPRPPRRMIQLGSFQPDTHLVRIHPVLDQHAVPRFFVRFVLFHELLHAALDLAEPDPDDAGEPAGRRRRVHHPPAFRERERAYPEFARAEAWQARNLSGLLRSARTGRPLRPAPLERARGLWRATQHLLFPEPDG